MPTENIPEDPFLREDRYIVIKRSDLDKMSPLDRDVALSNLEHVAALLFVWNAPERKCLVIESDWPEYEPAWQMIERRMAGQPPVTAAEELDAVLHWRSRHAQAVRERDALQQRLNEQDQQADDLRRAVRELLSNAINADGAGEMVVQRIDVDDLRNLLNPTPKPTCSGTCPAGCIGAKP
jgi:hypothetical protein